jgi:hypothetical protein
MAQPQRQNNPKAQLRQRLAQRHENHVAHREEREGKERERFTQSPTGKQARHQAKAAANVEYNPTIRGIREEKAGLRKQAGQASQWYNQLGSEQAAAAQSELGGANQFASSLTQQLAQANNQNAAYLASQQQAQAAQSALTGTPMAASEGQAAAAGANVGAANAVALNAPTLGAAYNQAALTNRLGIASKERGHEVSQGLLGERKKVGQDLLAAQKQKGQAYVGRLAEERESARKSELDKAAFALEGQEAAATVKHNQEALAQQEASSQRSAATSRANSQRTAASSAASTAASTVSANASAKNAAINAQEFAAERRYKKNHNGRTPAEVAALQKEGKPSTSEQNSKKESAQNASAAAATAINAKRTASHKSPAQYTEAEWLELEQHLTAPKTGKEPGAGIDPAVAARIVAELKRKAEAAAPVVKAAENIRP